MGQSLLLLLQQALHPLLPLLQHARQRLLLLL
jgi:hypothetical protein